MADKPLPSFITRLLDPSAYQERPASVELRQTHVSYLLFTPEFVYKIKKPVDFGFLDFTTLEKRLFFCREEVRLNGRLSEGVYLGVVPVVERDGAVTMGGDGAPVEYAVKMRRLSAETILDEMIRGGRVEDGDVERVAERIAAFHASAATDGRIASFGAPEAIRRNVEDNFDQTAAHVGKTISRERYDGVRGFMRGFLDANGRLFERRAATGRVKDCHGDIHAEHVSVTDRIDVIDCIEFNERFRFVDAVSDSSFLAMDLDCLGRADLSRLYERTYFDATGDAEGERLKNFYKCHLAYVRGKVEGLKSMEEEVPPADRRAALLSALYHYRLASLYAAGGFRPQLIIMRGLSGTGKTRLASLLASSFNMQRISSDEVRKRLAGVPLNERRAEGVGEGIYSGEFTEKTYSTLIDEGAARLKAGRPVVLDATFARSRHIDAAFVMGISSGLDRGSIRIIECTAPDEVALGRINERAGRPDLISDAGPKVYEEQKKKFERTSLARAVVDSSASPEDCLVDAAMKIFG